MSAEKAETFSLKSLRQKGKLKSRDLYRANIFELVVVPGQSGRDEDERFQQSIDELTQFMLDGGKVPPLEIEVDPKTGDVKVVQGHRRRLAYLNVIPTRQAEAKALGLSEEKIADLAFVECLPFSGNDLDRLTRIVSGNSHLAMTDIETGRIYADMQKRFGLNVSEVARATGHPRARVEMLLTVVNANQDVQQAVKDGTIKPTEAAKLAKAHGSDAGAVIETMAATAKAQGKKRVTAGIATGFSLPKPIVADLQARVHNLVSKLPKITANMLTAYKADPDQYDPDEFVQVPLAMLAGLAAAHANVEDTIANRAAKVLAATTKAATKTVGTDDF